MRWFPPARSRFDREAKRVFPDMKRKTRAKLGQDMGRHMGRTLFEIYHDAEFQTQHPYYTTLPIFGGISSHGETAAFGSDLSSLRS
jgi:lauroyl/myristoyl acyltransferase